MNQIVLFLFFLIAFLYIIGVISRRFGGAGFGRHDRTECGPGPGEMRYESEPDEETPGIEWEVTEGEAMLRQLVEHCKDNPGQASKLVKSWIIKNEHP